MHATMKKNGNSSAGILKRLGFIGGESGCVWGEVVRERRYDESVSTIDGKRLGMVRMASEADYEEVIKRAQEAFKAWRLVSAPEAWRPGAAAWTGAPRGQGRPGSVSHAGDGQDCLRGPGRSAGDDRYLRLCDGFITTALWADHRIGTAGTPDDGAVASARSGGCDYGF